MLVAAPVHQSKKKTDSSPPPRDPIIRRLALRMALSPSPRRGTVDPGPLGVDTLRKDLPDPADFRVLRLAHLAPVRVSPDFQSSVLGNKPRWGGPLQGLLPFWGSSDHF